MEYIKIVDVRILKSLNANAQMEQYEFKEAPIFKVADAPPEYVDRQTLWNAVEKVERHPKAQLAYSFDIALQNEFSLDENIALAS